MNRLFLLAGAVFLSLPNATTHQSECATSPQNLALANKVQQQLNSCPVSFSTEEIANMALSEINSVSKNTQYSIDNWKELHDLNGNKFLHVNFNPFGYSILSMETYKTIECNPLRKASKEINTGDVYYPVLGVFEQKAYSLISRQRHNSIPKSSFASLTQYSDHFQTSLAEEKQQSLLLKSNALKTTRSNSGGGNGGNQTDWVIDVSQQVVTADVEIPYSWFFKYNTDRFSYSNGGSDGICEYVAYLMLAEYNDFFKAKGYFSDTEISNYVFPVQAGTFETAIPNVSDDFVYQLYLNNGRKETLNTRDLNDLSNMFLSGKNVSYSNVSAYWMFGNPKDVIKNGKRPDMLCGYFPDIGDRGSIAHNIVAYGYFTKGPFAGKYLTHYGWDGDTQCIVDRSVFKTGYDWSLADHTKNPENRYIFSVDGVMRDGKSHL